MPVAVALIIKFAIGALITRLIISFGVAFFTADFVGEKVNEYLTNAYEAVNSSITGDLAALLGLMRFDEAIAILTGGIVMAASLKSFSMILKYT